MPKKSSSNSKTPSRTSSTPKQLPRLPQKPLPDDKSFNESTAASSDRLSTLWIIIFAFAILAVVSVVVWAVFSGRADQKIHGDNLNKLHSDCVAEDPIDCPAE